MKRITLILVLLLLFAACTPTEVPPTSTPSPTPIPTVPPTPIPVDLPIPLEDGCYPYFYNVNGIGLGDRPELERHHEVINPCGATVMDNMGLAYWMAERGTIVAVRSYSSAEGSQCLTDDPVNQINRFYNETKSFPQYVRDRLYWYGCSNEPSYGDNWQVTAILDAEIRMLNRATELGVHACSGNWGVGNFDSAHITQGLYDKYLRALDAGDHLLCVHEYTSLTLEFGTGLTLSREDLLHPERVQKNNWSTREEIEARCLTDLYNACWHLFRVYWLFNRAEEIGLDYPYVMITEGLHDHLDDINRQEPRALQILDDRWGMQQYDGDLRGAPSHCRLWEEFYYPQWSCEQAYIEQILWWVSVKHPNIIAVNAFTWSYNDMWRSFNLSNRQMQIGQTFDVFDFRRRLEACVLANCQFKS